MQMAPLQQWDQTKLLLYAVKAAQAAAPAAWRGVQLRVRVHQPVHLSWNELVQRQQQVAKIVLAAATAATMSVRWGA